MITVITDQLTKYIHLVPSKSTLDAVHLAHLLVNHVFVYYGMPEKITSNRDKLFTLKFWQSLTDLIDIDQKLTTAYHPQENGQTERTN